MAGKQLLAIFMLAHRQTAIPKIARAASVQKLTTKARRTQRASGSEKAMADCGLFDALGIGEAGTNTSSLELPAFPPLLCLVFFVSLW
jgi:hypothetical protein